MDEVGKLELIIIYVQKFKQKIKKYFPYLFSQKIGRDISCRLSTKEFENESNSQSPFLFIM